MQGNKDRKQRGKPRGIRRDRDCGSCKLRGIKCDLNRPRCLPCVQAELPCGYVQKVVWATEVSSEGFSSRSKRRPQSVLVVSPPAPTGPGLPDYNAEPPGIVQEQNISGSDAQSTERLSLIKRLEGFCDRITAMHMDGRSSKAGGYLSGEAIRLVERIWDFMHARIPGYVYHYSMKSEETPESMESVRHYLEALMVLNETLATANPVALLGIATFAFFEVCDGPFGEWQCHLYGARSLLDHHCNSRLDLDRLSQEITGLTEIVAHLVWFDTIGTIIRGHTGLIFDDWHRQTLDESFFNGVGCPSETFNLFVDLAKVDIASNALDFSIRAMDQLLKVEKDQTDRAHSANAYRCTAVIAVLSRMRDVLDNNNYNIDSANSRSRALASAVDQVCEAIASIPSTSRYFTHLAATAYMAGLNANTVEQCNIVRSYWQNCRSVDFTHYMDAQARCEERWRVAGLG